MTDSGRAVAGSIPRTFALSILAGVVLAVATSLLFLLIILVPLIGISIGLQGLRGRPRDPSSTAAGGGLLLGAGAVYLYGALNTLISCGDSAVCGGASALPLLAWALVILVVGAVMSGITFWQGSS